MDKRDLVYRLTEIVYRHAGDSVPSEKIKNMVRELMAFLPSSDVSQVRSPESSPNTSIITVFGKSRPGIVAGITTVLAENKVDITDITQTLLGKNFAMIIVCDITNAPGSFTDLKAKLTVKGEELGVSVFAQHEELFHSMHKV
ncbi:MAG: ACT domain-containing protein [Desulfobacterales bacterium]|nr:ACT domain-containing protein [Desulfobacterales bacterium]